MKLCKEKLPIMHYLYLPQPSYTATNYGEQTDALYWSLTEFYREVTVGTSLSSAECRKLQLHRLA